MSTKLAEYGALPNLGGRECSPPVISITCSTSTAPETGAFCSRDVAGRLGSSVCDACVIMAGQIVIVVVVVLLYYVFLWGVVFG